MHRWHRMRLLTIGNPKTAKGEAQGYLTAVLHLAPANVAGLGTVCAKATAGCMATCLNTAGRGGIFVKGATTNTIQEARKRRTAHYKLDRTGFENALAAEIEAAERMAKRHGLTLCVRVNGTSDLRALAIGMAERFPHVQFYDYTKLPLAHGRMPLPNYHLTFSRSERNASDVVDALENGMNVAVVFSTRRGKPLPRYAYAGGRRYDVIDGDAHDLRFLDPHGTRGVVVGLRAKGRARKDTSGFVVNAFETQHVA
jgi:hypothetical protein